MPHFSPVWSTDCSTGLYVTPESVQHIVRHRGALDAVRSAVDRLDLTVQDYPLNVEVLADGMSWPVQRLALLEPVGLKETSLFVYRDGRSWPSHVSVDPDPPCVSQITLVIRSGSPRPRLVTAWIGGEMFREPQDHSLSDSDYARAVIFWRQHAFVWNPKAMGNPFEATWEQVLAKQC